MIDVSVIICVRNSADMLLDCLKAARQNSPREIIVVDGMSTDGSYEIAKQYADKVLSDDGKGLSYARKIGVEVSIGRYILNMGPDNILPTDFLQEIVRLACSYSYQGAGVQTRMGGIVTRWDSYLDDWWKYMMGVPGPREVIGTPSLFERYLLNEEPFNENTIGCDDTDLCSRLRSRGYSLGIVPLVVYDSPNRKWWDIYEKFMLYGRGDANFYNLYSPRWNLKRKLYSLTHPLRHFIRAIKWSIANKKSMSLYMFFILITAIRYLGWINTSYKQIKAKNFH